MIAKSKDNFGHPFVVEVGQHDTQRLDGEGESSSGLEAEGNYSPRMETEEEDPTEAEVEEESRQRRETEKRNATRIDSGDEETQRLEVEEEAAPRLEGEEVAPLCQNTAKTHNKAYIDNLTLLEKISLQDLDGVFPLLVNTRKLPAT